MSSTKLFAPKEYWEAKKHNPALIGEVCNGCGTSGWKGKLVPETMWGLDISAACDIHDWMYFHGKSEEDRLEADRVFLNNLFRLINAYGGWLAWLRRYRATTYYNAVRVFGAEPFWWGKNPPETLGSVSLKA